MQSDALIPHAAYWSMFCGYKLGDADKIMRFKDLAERDTSMLNFVKQYEAEAYWIQKDTTMYVKSLQEGFKQYPNFAFFFPRLVEYYTKKGEKKTIKAEGLLAQAIQHEIDHLNGKLFIDQVIDGQFYTFDEKGKKKNIIYKSKYEK